MAIWLLAGLIWATIGINSQHVEDPEAAAIGDEVSHAYHLRNASRMPVIVLGEPIRVLGTEEEGDGDGPGFVFGDGIEEGDELDDQEGGEEEDEEGDEGEQQASLPIPQPNINMRQVYPDYLKISS